MFVAVKRIHPQRYLFTVREPVVIRIGVFPVIQTIAVRIKLFSCVKILAHHRLDDIGYTVIVQVIVQVRDIFL